jgi:serine/threonine protein kinase
VNTDDPEKSLSDDATFAGGARPQRADISIGDERTLSDGLADQETIIDDIKGDDFETRYRIEGQLGQGGMGAVLLATDTRLDRKVAIKRILGETAGNRTAVNRFLTEAKSIAALNHPNIVQIYDYGRAKDGPFLVMEFVDGGSLLDRCRDGAMPLEDAVDLACQLCDGLAKAHDLGIIHRDIKPANVLLTKDGIPKLTDFGLAKAQAGDHGQTMTGAVLGTPDFMPPEQRRDAALVDHRSDLWSLAATVYQMLTGRSPKVIRLHELPQALQGVLAKALEDAKESRYQSARAFRDALKASLRSAAAARPDHELVAGICPACAAQNEPGRKFCRGCGESLIAPCLQCSQSLPLWDEICGECGAKQSSLVESRRQALAARQAEAEGLLGDFEFDRAVAVTMDLQDSHHPRIRQLSGWVTTFLEQVEKSRAEQTRQAAEALVEASKHEAAHDYLSAVLTLETIPKSLRTSALPGVSESAAMMLSRVKDVQAEVRWLEDKVKQQLAANALDELMPDIEGLLALQPNRDDLKTLRGQLLERQEKSRDEAVAAANAHIAADGYESALRVLGLIPAAMVTPEVVQLREQAEGLVRQVRGLAGKIKAAVAAKQFDGLIGVVEKYLALKPADAEMGKLRKSLVDREEKIGAEITSRLEQASMLEKDCRFEHAHKALCEIPKCRRDAEANSKLDRMIDLATTRRKVMALLLDRNGDPHEVSSLCEQYGKKCVATKIEDTEFTALWMELQTELQNKRLREEKLKTAFIITFLLLLFCIVPMLIIFLAIGLYR